MNNTFKIRICNTVLSSLVLKMMGSPFITFHVKMMRKTFLGFLCIANQSGNVKK